MRIHYFYHFRLKLTVALYSEKKLLYQKYTFIMIYILYIQIFLLWKT